MYNGKNMNTTDQYLQHFHNNNTEKNVDEN